MSNLEVVVDEGDVGEGGAVAGGLAVGVVDVAEEEEFGFDLEGAGEEGGGAGVDFVWDFVVDAVGWAVAYDDVGGGGDFGIDFGEASFGEVECAPEGELPGGAVDGEAVEGYEGILEVVPFEVFRDEFGGSFENLVVIACNCDNFFCGN